MDQIMTGFPNIRRMTRSIVVIRGVFRKTQYFDVRALHAALPPCELRLTHCCSTGTV